MYYFDGAICIKVCLFNLRTTSLPIDFSTKPCSIKLVCWFNFIKLFVFNFFFIFLFSSANLILISCKLLVICLQISDRVDLGSIGAFTSVGLLKIWLRWSSWMTIFFCSSFDCGWRRKYWYSFTETTSIAFGWIFLSPTRAFLIRS